MEESAAANRCQPAAEHQGAGLAGISANKQVNKPSLIGPLEQLRRVLEAIGAPKCIIRTEGGSSKYFPDAHHLALQTSLVDNGFLNGLETTRRGAGGE